MLDSSTTTKLGMLTLIRYGWALPASLLGVVLVMLALASGGKARLHSGVWEAAGGWPGRRLARGMPFSGPVAAITFGHVVLGTSERAVRDTRAHEREHVRQYERWGALFFLAYAAAGTWVGLRGGDPYRDNPFEVAARRAETTKTYSSTR